MLRAIAPLLAVAIGLAVALQPGMAAACAAAEQLRLFPLGTADERIVALELHWKHDDAPKPARSPTAEMKWRGTASIVSLNPSGHEREQLAAWKASASDAEVEKVLGQLVARARARARDLVPNLRALRPPEVQLCQVGKPCPRVRARISKQTLLVAIGKGKRRKSSRIEIAPHTGDVIDTSPWGAQAPEWLASASVGSIRRYRSNGGSFHIVHFSSGIFEVDGQDAVSRRRRKLSPGQCKSISSCHYAEALGHHALGVDVLISTP